ncbi:MAG: DUF2071 domain-containing protein [Planctomycetaceae bacterium]|nr:DUF2071 domain-containing protein [Planctomycetaceae bacterium]
MNTLLMKKWCFGPAVITVDELSEVEASQLEPVQVIQQVVAAERIPDFARRAEFQVRPDEPPVMHQSWQRLLFLHWRVDPEEIQAKLPPGLTVDTFDGSAWVAIVPFEMAKIRPTWAPAVPWLSWFLELNLRTYAYDENGVPGVWFLSLSANRKIAVDLAKWWFHLPYHWSSMKTWEDHEGFTHYQCRRFSDPEKRGCEFRYRPTGEVFSASPGTLEFFLAERYILFADVGNGSIATGQVHHPPYPLQIAEVEKWDARVFEIDGLTLPSEPPASVLYSPGVDVEVFSLKKTL